MREAGNQEVEVREILVNGTTLSTSSLQEVLKSPLAPPPGLPDMTPDKVS